MSAFNCQTDRLLASVNDQIISNAIDKVYRKLFAEFETAYAALPKKFMPRIELTFHDHVKMVAHTCLATADLEGAVVEIGVWKGLSLALAERFLPKTTTLVGIDPCALEGQLQELSYFQMALFPNAHLIPDYSYRCISKVATLVKGIKVLHIDGGHNEWDVWADFLLYERLIIPGGYVVFDDYNDYKHSPDVKVGVDGLAAAGYFDDYHLLGVIEPFTNDFVIRRKLRWSSIPHQKV